MKKFIKNIINWIKNNKSEFILILIILGIAAFFRFYRLSETFYFIADAGRDAQAIYKIIIDHKLTLIGPRASVAGFFLGPFYFYFAAIPFWLAGTDPLGLAFFSSFLGVLAVFLIYLVVKNLFDSRAALFAAFLYASSAIIINYSRMAWNPSPLPVFTLLLILFLIYLKKTQKIRWLVFSWIIVGLGIQLHYNFLYFIPGILLYSYLMRKIFWHWLKFTFLGGLIILFLNSPLIIFDVRHDFLTSKAFFAFLFSDKVSFGSFNILAAIFQNIRQVFELVILMGFFSLIKVAAIIFLILILILKKIKLESIGFLLIIFLPAILFFSFFRGTIQLYYYNFILPFPVLFLSYIAFFLNKGRVGRMTVIAFTLFFFWKNLDLNLNPSKPEFNLQQIKSISSSIVAKVPDSTSYNIASFSKEPWHSAEEYRYFSYYFGKKAAGAEDYKNIKKLYLIATEEMEDPLNVHSQETDDFGPKIVEDSWTIESVKIFQLGK